MSDGDLQSRFEAGKKLLAQLRFSRKWLSFSFRCLVAIWLIYSVIAWVHSPIAFARSGAGLVFGATALSGFHLWAVDRSKREFGVLRNGGIQNAEVSRELEVVTGDEPNTLWKLNIESQREEAEVIAGVIRWEVPLASFGTLVWGYGDAVRNLFLRIVA